MENNNSNEKSSREKIMDEVYTWRIGYNPDLANDTYGEFKSVFDLSKEELQTREQEQALEACMIMFKGSLSMDRTIIHNAIAQIVTLNHSYETLRLQYTLDEHDKPIKLDTILKFNTKDAINIVFSKEELYILVYDVKEDNTCEHIIGSLKVPFNEYGGIHIYIDGYELKSTIEDNIDKEAYQTIIKDERIKSLFEIVYQLIYMKERHVWRDFIDHLK